MDFNSLNLQQKKAVEQVGGPMLVFAGAGSGKTRVLTYKIAHLIENAGLPPENILAVTFTNKAAQEMKSRVFDLVKRDLDGITIGTFHSIGSMILRKEIKLIDYENNFVIYDSSDSRSLVKKVIKKLNLDIKLYDPKSIQYKISSAKNLLQSPNDVLKLSNEREFIKKNFVEIYRNYQRSLKENNALDFDDLLTLPLQIFEENPKRLEFYQNKFQYVLVDEYQDTNKPQFELIYQLTKNNKDIFVVGDDDQSIYGWRGADISNILNFNESFSNATVIKLEQNYRSTQNILNAAWSVVSRNINRSEKKLWTENKEGEKISVLHGYNERDESLKVFNKINEIKNSENSSFKDFVILYRTNAQSRPIEHIFMSNSMHNNYHIVGGTKFYERKEIKDLIAYLRLFVNNKDAVSFDRIINFPPRGIGKTSLDKVYDSDLSPLNAIKNIDNFNLGKKQKKSFNDFSDFVKLFSDKSQSEKPSEIVKDLIDELKLKDYYQNQKTPDSLDRWRNIEEFVSSIVENEVIDSQMLLSDYLEEISLLTDVDSWSNQQDKVTLMTIHSAKGLEFKYVFIVGMEDGLFPSIRPFDDEDIEEERRLFYVGLTRAHERVFLSYAKMRRKFGSEPIPSIKSRFLMELPEDLIENKKEKLSFVRDSYKVSTKNENIELSDLVEHKIFGKGRVVNIEGEGGNSKITILFFNNERKKLIYKYANLKKISG